ncbi:hypothetical protein F4778DRAFT_801988 [Xylariomycetidae sp. FL2044]|nr:hypothetical protein F4778DRAFT_801988 [Xylariomycetidae sp. FL2044]
MSEMTAAIDQVAAGLDGHSGHLDTESRDLNPDRSSRDRRRRSSSRMQSARHDVSDEQPPRDRFHEPSFQQAFTDARRYMGELTEVLSASPLHLEPGSEMQRLHRQGDELARFQCPSKRTVGLIGDSGVGKSSTVNSLLDAGMLARTSSNGAACTCLVTEYHYHERDDFVIKAELFSIEEIARQQAELLSSYRHFHLHGNEIDNPEDRQAAEKRAKLAADTLRSMFPGRLAKRFVTDSPEDLVLATLRSWVEDIDFSAVSGRQARHSIAECADHLRSLTSEQTSVEEQPLWPFIKKISVFLKSHILSRGLVLVDLPGLRDLNSARQNITERYLLHCDEIFVIAKVARATSDAGVMAVFELTKHVKLFNVNIVCTNSDIFEAAETKYDWKGDKRKKVDELLTQLKRSKKRLQELDNVDEDEEREISRALRKTRLKKFIMETRNGEIKAKLLRLYGPVIPGNELRVFCVSNKYWENREKPKDIALPKLELSGIIELRKHCISIVAESQLRAARTFIRDGIPALLGDLDLWVQSGASDADAERKRLVRETLNTVETRFRMELTGRESEVSGLAKAANQDFKNSIYSLNQHASWSHSASSAAREWSRVMSYSAFCRNYGDHATATIGRRNWNAEAMAAMVQDLRDPWQAVHRASEDRIDDVTELVETLVEWAIEHLVSELSESDLTTTLSQALESRGNLMTAAIQQCWEDFDHKFRILGADALSPINTSIFGESMTGSYDACNDEYGSDRRKKTIIATKLGDPTLFPDLTREFRDRFAALAKSGLQDGVRDVVMEHLGHVRRTLDLARRSGGDGGERDEGTATVVQVVDPGFRRRVGEVVGELRGKVRLVGEIAIG